jgi:hypothetical protein
VSTEVLSETRSSQEGKNYRRRRRKRRRRRRRRRRTSEVEKTGGSRVMSLLNLSLCRF